MQVGRETGNNRGMDGTGMTSKASGSMLLDFVANMSRSKSAVALCSIFLIHHISDCFCKFGIGKIIKVMVKVTFTPDHDGPDEK